MGMGVRLLGGVTQDDNLVWVRPISSLGSETGCVMAAPTDTPDAADTEIKSSATGWRMVKVQALSSITAGESVILAWGTSATDTDVETNVNLAVTSHGTPAGTEYPNQAFLTPLVPFAIIEWDGTTSIKRFCGQATGGAQVLAVELVAAD